MNHSPRAGTFAKLLVGQAQDASLTAVPWHQRAEHTKKNLNKRSDATPDSPASRMRNAYRPAIGMVQVSCGHLHDRRPALCFACDSGLFGQVR